MELFLKGLRVEMVHRGLNQKLLAEVVGLSPVSINKYFSDKGDVPSAESVNKICAGLGVSEDHLISAGMPIPPVKSTPTSHIASFDVAMEAQQTAADVMRLAGNVMKLAEQNKKRYDRMKMWHEIFMQLPTPFLLTKDGVVVAQNSLSSALGDALGKSLCESGLCADDNCPGDACPMRIAIASGKPASACRYIKGDYCKVTATPLTYDGHSYMIIQATEINECAKKFVTIDLAMGRVEGA